MTARTVQQGITPTMAFRQYNVTNSKQADKNTAEATDDTYNVSHKQEFQIRHKHLKQTHSSLHPQQQTFLIFTSCQYSQCPNCGTTLHLRDSKVLLMPQFSY